MQSRSEGFDCIDGAGMNGPLNGLRVIDTTQYVAGPFCALLLADLGAEVIKIERPDRGDVYRVQGPHFINGESITFLSLNRDKQSVTVNLKDPRGQEIVHRLVGDADIFLENSKPGTMTRLHLGYDELAEINERLIYCSISGYGQYGPYAHRGGYDLTIQGESGVMSVTGEPESAPVKVGVPVLDFGAAMYGVIGILAAAVERERTNRGRHVDVALLDGAVSWLNMLVASYLANGQVPGPMGSASPFFAPYQAYRTRDGYITITGTGGNDAWGTLCRVIGREALRHDPRFITNTERIQHLPELTQEIEAALAVKSSEEWLQALELAGVPCALLNTVDTVIEDPQVRARGMLTQVEHPRAGLLTLVATPIKFGDPVAQHHAAPPLLGQHTDHVLGILGYSAVELQVLRHDKVI